MQEPVPARVVAGRSRRGEAIALSAILVAGAIAISVALAIRSRRSAATGPQAAAAAHGPNGKGARAGKKGVQIRTKTSGGEVSDPEEPPPAGLQAVLDDKWTHPEPGPFRELPPNETTRFGAYRSREVYKHEYCGSGHCGVDLGNKVGLPILAARDGTIQKVAFQPTEVEGKWILMAHEGGLHSYYMHLDEVKPDLAVGMFVSAGTMIGTLGTTGIKRSEPHLHFMISFDAPNGKELFVDPEPIVREARLIEINELPAWVKARH